MAARTFLSTFLSGVGLDSLSAAVVNFGIRPGAKLMCFGQATNTVAGNTANQNIGFVSLPAIGPAATGTVTVANTLVTANSIIRCWPQNSNGDATANRNVDCWAAAITAGTSFVMEYNAVAAMGATWVGCYEIIN